MADSRLAISGTLVLIKDGEIIYCTHCCSLLREIFATVLFAVGVIDWGRTVYAFSPDSFNLNKFTKPDFSNNSFWPIYEGNSVSHIPSALSASDFATTTVFGKTQITYRGWPMYYFGPDAMTRGKTLGISVPQPGVWPVMLRSSPEAPK